MRRPHSSNSSCIFSERILLTSLLQSTSILFADAVHEAGHALVASYLGYGIAKISIVPYTSGMGGVTILDADDFENMKFKTRSKYFQFQPH